MTTHLTLAEIKSQFADEWVLIGEPQTNKFHEIQGGYVLFHSKDRDEMDRQMIALRPSRFALLYTGTMPKDTAIVL